MAIIHRVIVLNKPFKLFGYSFGQLIFLAIIALIACWLWFSTPPVKINGLPLGLFIFLGIFGAGIVFVHASLIKPSQWWRNRFLSLAKLLPTEILPKPQPTKTYFENSIKETNNLPNSTFRTNSTIQKDKWQL